MLVDPSSLIRYIIFILFLTLYTFEILILFFFMEINFNNVFIWTYNLNS